MPRWPRAIEMLLHDSFSYLEVGMRLCRLLQCLTPVFLTIGPMLVTGFEPVTSIKAGHPKIVDEIKKPCQVSRTFTNEPDSVDTNNDKLGSFDAREIP